MGFCTIAVALLQSSIVGASPRLGVAVIQADGSACVTFRGASVRAGEKILLILFSPPRVVDGDVRGKAPAPCDKTLIGDAQAYRVQLRYSMGGSEELGIAVFDAGARAEYHDGEFIVQTREAKVPLRFRQCASGEGVHLTAWRGNRRTWHEYWYVGFDLESTCTDEETRE
jgi:hypothetical protein